MDVTLRIKNLSIALEALSHSHHSAIGDRVYGLLMVEIKKLQKENEEANAVRPTEPSTDDIPF